MIDTKKQAERVLQLQDISYFVVNRERDETAAASLPTKQGKKRTGEALTTAKSSCDSAAAMSLFKSFTPSKGDISSSTAVKSSVQRGMRNSLLSQYPALAENEGALLEQIWPKKEDVTLVKFAREHVSFLVLKGKILFWQHFDGPYCPELHLLHQCESTRAS